MDSVQPLRISKTTPSSSPTKPAMVTSRPLSEIGSTERRRNSPSYNQATRKMIVSRDASPYTENDSPNTSVLKASSPRDFWSGRDSSAMSPFRFDDNENERSPSPSPQRRSSIEKLKQASRVKNSNIFALETKDAYDPSSLPIVERPSANRELAQRFVNNSFTRFDSQRKENTPLRSSPQRSAGHKRSETETNITFTSPSKVASSIPLPLSPEKPPQGGSPSPTKSSLRASQFGLHNTNFDNDDDSSRVPTPRAARFKSVTFHAEPPVINEYEQQTPEPSVATASDREGSWDSEDFSDQDLSFDRGSSADIPEYHEADGDDGDEDDSFNDPDLENADKTPVVLPEDWSRMSPDEARTDLVNAEDDVFDAVDAKEDDAEAEDEPTQRITDRIPSNTSESSRPLPPLPGFMARARRDSDSLVSAAERAAAVGFSPRGITAPKRASVSKDEILKTGSASSLTLQERLELIERPTSQSSSSQDTVGEDGHSRPEELTITNLDTGKTLSVQVAEKEVMEGEEEVSVLVDMSCLDDEYQPPRISRESILRKVRNAKYDFEDEDENEDEEFQPAAGRPSIAELAKMDPDQAVPSRENSAEMHGLAPEEEAGYDVDDDVRAAIAYSAEQHSEEKEEVPAPPASSAYTPEAEAVKIKEEPLDDTDENGTSVFDMSAIPVAVTAFHSSPRQSPSRNLGDERQTSVLRHDIHGNDIDISISEDDSMSRYSDSEPPDAESTMIHTTTTTQETTIEYEDGGAVKETLLESMELLTVKDYSSSSREEPTKQGGVAAAKEYLGFDLPSYLGMELDDDYDFGMKEWITPSPPAGGNDARDLSATKMPALQPPAEIEQQLQPSAVAVGRPEHGSTLGISPPGTPDSVVHRGDDHDGGVSPIELEEPMPPKEPERNRDSDPGIPERIASIKTGGKLKARPSANQADFDMMAEQRRTVSAEVPNMPSIPRAHQAPDVEDVSAERPESSQSNTSQKENGEEEKKVKATPNRRKSRKSGGIMDHLVDLGLDTSTFSIIGGEEDGLGLDEEFDRVIESQKVGIPPVFPPPLHARFAADDAAQQQLHVHYTSSPSPFRPHLQDAGADGFVRKQKGYLMRQNTKVVVASNRNVSGESNGTAKSKDTTTSSDEPPMSPTTARPTSRGARSPRKASGEQFLKTEPWNGKMRRKSVRAASAQKFACRNEAAPPLPGQESALGVVDEDYAAGTSTLEDDVEEGVERGRLFVKVVGVKDLDLPMPRNDRVFFQLTLDNGLHCVTTASLELGTSAPIGQEFELVVLNDLEFQLTLTTKLPPAPAASSPPMPAPSSPTKSLKGQKTGAFSRFLSSPKKRAEKERLEREAAEQESRRLFEEHKRKRASLNPTAWDQLRQLVNASDGSFARAYVNLAAHEKVCFGRPMMVDVPCYNEWALEQDAAVVNSVRSKRGMNHGGAQIRRPPYVVGKLELQLLYVPKPRGATDEDMPKSMSGAIRAMNRASDVVEVGLEGHLSQQGGDCIHWRRRFFRLQGSKLTAYHEHTHQKRAVINLTKASRLVDDKRTLVADPSSPTKSGKGRRKSAFAEEDEGYQYVEEGFRIRFANGETIDFYADNRAQKELWMGVLSQVIGKPDQGQKATMWTDLVLARERAEAAKRPASSAGDAPWTSASGASSPVKGETGGGTDVRDFTKPPPAAQRQNSYRKPVATPRPASKSASNSPMKGQQTTRTAAPAPPQATPGARPKTPPMKPRTGHRSREAVKSMIF